MMPTNYTQSTLATAVQYEGICIQALIHFDARSALTINIRPHFCRVTVERQAPLIHILLG